MKMLTENEMEALEGYDNGDVFTCTLDEMLSGYYSVYLCTGMNKPKNVNINYLTTYQLNLTPSPVCKIMK